MVEAHYLIIVFCSYILTHFSQAIPIPGYTLSPAQSISDGQTLVSKGGKFELGFFSPSASSKNRYLGIWYKTIPDQKVIWVANRESPVHDRSGVVKLTESGNIVIINVTESLIWSSNSSKVVENPTLEFLESGNIVLRDVKDEDRDNYIWQSFDHPTDTLIPDMRLGANSKTGMNIYLSSWKSFDDPSRGDFTYGMELSGYPEIVMRNGSKMYYRGGSWNGIQNTGAPDLSNNSIFTYAIVQNADEFSLTTQLVDQSVILHTALLQTSTEGKFERSVWFVNKSNSWDRLLSIPRDSCDEYARCGIYSTCDTRNVVTCQCLEGFKPKSPQEWNATDWSQGCEREVPLNCSNGEGFRKHAGLKLPDTAKSSYNLSMPLEECRVMCLNDCSCLAYANALITGGGSGCIRWFTDLIDIKQFSHGGQDLYIRMPASESDFEAKSGRSKSVTAIVSVTSVVGFIGLGFAIWYYARRIRKKRGLKGISERGDLELPLYDLYTIAIATNNFSTENKLGEGGFGPVYKGKLGGQDIAVKRLSKDSTQGVDAFKNEVILISKLQHRNLVRLLGCCIQGEEKMLVYEYMPNNSLDLSIFDETKRRLLDWQRRFQIIKGIAGGLHYLHHDSRLRIIHRDLKASNVLLDQEMVPKISDFGMARIFGGDQVEAETKRVVGTHGYMSPEYMIDGHFSAKSDVFSFGVLVLEIVSGKKNRGFHHPGHALNLLGHAWTLYCEDMSSEFVDKSMGNSSFDHDALRCIHIGLLCVQREVARRPTMSSVVTMLSSEIAVLPRPQRPGFYMERTSDTSNSSSTNTLPSNSSDFTITLLEGR